MLRPLVAIITFLILDAIWVGLIATKLYTNTIGHLLRMSGGQIQPNWLAAIVVYIALIIGVLVFAIPKAHGNPWMALVWGALFGAITYATYDFTNLSVLANWPLSTSIIDTIWGAVLCGITAFVASWV